MLTPEEFRCGSLSPLPLWPVRRPLAVFPAGAWPARNSPYTRPSGFFPLTAPSQTTGRWPRD